MVTRRDWLKLAAATGAALSLRARLLHAQGGGSVIRRRIPATGEELPIVGLGSSATFREVANEEDFSAVRDVLRALLDNGGTVFDTAPGYGASEEIAGQVVRDLGVQSRVFWATKINVVNRATRRADPAAARAQVEESFRRVGKDPIDLIQVHSLGDLPTQLGLLKELKAQGRVRYIGVTTTDNDRYEDIAEVMRREPIDFIGIDYAVDNRQAADVVLPLAEDRGIGVLVYAPFGRTRLWRRVASRELPSWASEFGATTWAQFFIKYVAAHPAVTAVTPATSRPENMIDNLGGGTGALPDEATRRRMAELVDALPQT
ncbi:MAG TPA: aldo/keto reductase [Gammaproteobacteria bacterium]|nr:aldo/keto reductase [Gammaproteobacteria bacterium]